MKRAFLLAALFILVSLIPAPSCAVESCTDLGNILRKELKDPSALLHSFEVWGIRKCDLLGGNTMCFQCEEGVLYTQSNPKTGHARIGQGCPCKSTR
jgi:hypothetical protein